MKKKFLMVGIGTTLLSGIANADYIYDAALLLKEQKIEVADLKEKFTESEIKAVELKVKEIKAKTDDKQKSIKALTRKRAMELKQAGTKKSTEDQERDRDRTKDLEKETQIKERHEKKDLILIGDLEKNLNKRISKLETRVSNLEKKGKATSNAVKEGTKKTAENKKEQKVSKKEAADLIIRGKLGDGEDRKQKLKELGFSDKEILAIQKEVNRLIETDHIKVNLD